MKTKGKTSMRHFEMYPTIVTPFLADGAIDYEGLEKLVDLFYSMRCEGIFAVCQSSEMFFLTEEEKLTLAERMLALCRARGMKCVVSGHTQASIDAQIGYLKALEALRPDAIILVSNRFAAQDEGDEAALQNLKSLLDAMAPDTLLGVYECPYPYKRLLTPAQLAVMRIDGRFRFVKDTCCEIGLIRERLKLLEGSGISLYNANMATLLESVQCGAAGYSGVMLNLMPEFFALLHRAMRGNNNSRTELLCAHLTAASVIECQNYPANAKYCLMKRGIFSTTRTRNGNPPLTESQIKELDAFIGVNRLAYPRFLLHAPTQLLFGYDTVFPECHASSVLPLADGRVLAAYFAGANEKADDVGIWLSVREREVWQKPRLIAKVGKVPHWNPVLFETAAGVRIVFKVGKEIKDWESYAMLSEDFGETWSAPACFGADNPAGGPVRCKPLRLADGRLLAPNSDEPGNAWLPRVDISIDGGKSFQRLASIPIEQADASSPNYLPGLGAIQPTLWESAPGRVHALLRTTAGWIYRSDSTDGGATWCTAYPTRLPNNNSGIDLAAACDTLYLAMNPVSAQKGPRTPLVVLRSQDNGATFEDFVVLADDLLDDSHGKTAQFSYPAIAEREGRLYITFTHQRKSIAFSEIHLSKA